MYLQPWCKMAPFRHCTFICTVPWGTFRPPDLPPARVPGFLPAASLCALWRTKNCVALLDNQPAHRWWKESISPHSTIIPQGNCGPDVETRTPLFTVQASLRYHLHFQPRNHEPSRPPSVLPVGTPKNLPATNMSIH